MNTTRKKVILYKRATFLAPTGKTLQDHVKDARRVLTLASQRALKDGEGDEHVRIWNSRADRGLTTCGMFHSYEAGKSQMILDVADGAEEYSVVAAAPSSAKGLAHPEFNEGLLFFGIYQNHVLVVQSPALRVTAFEAYLNWFLQDATTELGTNNRLQLSDPTPQRITRDRKIDPLKSLTLTPQLHAELSGDLAHINPPREKVKDLRVVLNPTEWHPIRDLLRSMGGDVPDDLKLDGDFNPARVQVKIELKWLGRNKDRVETPLLDAVLYAFRDVDNPPIKGTTVSGETIEGDGFRLKRVEFFQVDGKNPLPGDVYEKMSKYLAELLERGDIKPE